MDVGSPTAEAPDPPQPVLQLSYEDPSTGALRSLHTISRGVTLLVIFRQSISVLQFAVGTACYFWNAATMPPALHRLVPGPVLFFELPEVMAAMAVASTAFACLKFNDAARRLLVRLNKLQLITSPAALLATAMYYQSTRAITQYGMAYEAYTLCRYLIAAVFAIGLTLATIMFFNHASTRTVFEESKTLAINP